MAEGGWVPCRGCHCGGQPGASHSRGLQRGVCSVWSPLAKGMLMGQVRAPGSHLWPRWLPEQLSVDCHFSWLCGPRHPPCTCLGTFLAAVRSCVFVQLTVLQPG